MRAAVLVIVLALSVEIASCRHATSASGEKGIEEVSASAPAVPQVATAEPPPPAPEPAIDPVPSKGQPSIDQARVDFNSDVRPILEAGCQPCHFPGGVMYERRPFDRPETITTLGTKLFTRIKDEDERRIINEFLAQQGAAKP